MSDYIHTHPYHLQVDDLVARHQNDRGVVRNQTARLAMRGVECPHCQDYFDAVDLPRSAFQLQCIANTYMISWLCWQLCLRCVWN